MNVFNSPEFKELQRIYYAKLKFEGFEDIENERGELRQFENSSSFSKRIGFKTDLVDQISGYFDWAVERALMDRFQSHLDQDIWTLHANGQSSRDIANRFDCDQTWVCRKIKKIREYLK